MMAVLVIGFGALPTVADAEDKVSSFFVGTDGVPLLTNNHRRYRNDPNYFEVQIDFQPVIVSSKYRLKGMNQSYTQGDYADLVKDAANRYRIPQPLIYAVIQVESNFDPNAVSKAGAQGLMQLMPGTAAEMGITDAFDPAQNVMGGSQYLSKLLAMFKGDRKLALAAYNAGPGNVKKYGDVPPFKETQRYIRKIEDLTGSFSARKERPLFQTRIKKRFPTYVPTDDLPVVVYFKGGSSQPAEAITVRENDYIIKMKNKQFVVKKNLVDRIEKLS
jgi:hypothetical protein